MYCAWVSDSGIPKREGTCQLLIFGLATEVNINIDFKYTRLEVVKCYQVA